MSFLRSQSDMEGGRIRTAPNGHLASNRNEIFARTPAVTKEMLQKLQNAELGPKKARLCGYEFNIRQISILIALFILFVLSSVGSYTFWYTDTFRNFVTQNMAISNDSDLYHNFVNPSRSYVKAHIYNYTNVHEVSTGKEKKFKVEELGPYVYEDRIHRSSINFSDDGTYVRYQESHSYKFVPEQSNGHMQMDRVTVPNIPMLSGAAMFRRSFFLTRLGMSTLMKQLNAQPFVTLGADRFILGYDDELFTLARNMMAFKNQPFPFEKFGLLATRKQNPDWMEMWTGKDDINKVGTVKSINNKDHMNNWQNEECDSVSGVDGVLYGPDLVHEKKRLTYLYKDFCHKTPLDFVKETKVWGGTMKAHRYVIPESAFSHPSQNPENQGYCGDDGTCAPHGLWNATICAFGTPIFISMPHFLGADPALRLAVDGITPPNPEEHQTTIDFHPYMGFIMRGWNRVQTNIQVQKSFGMSGLGMFEDDMILPVAWLEFGGEVETHPDYIKDVFNDATYLVGGLDLALRFGSVVMMFVTAVCFFIVLVRNKSNKVDTSMDGTIIS